MRVSRIVTDLQSDDPQALAGFYQGLLGLDIVMDQGFVVTLQGAETGPVQLTVLSGGGSGAPAPALSVEVDDLDAVIARMADMGVEAEYGPVTEPWGVRRLFVRDPEGTLVNILTHSRDGAGRNTERA